MKIEFLHQSSRLNFSVFSSTLVSVKVQVEVSPQLIKLFPSFFHGFGSLLTRQTSKKLLVYYSTGRQKTALTKIHGFHQI
jgi:hypothetical protein